MSRFCRKAVMAAAAAAVMGAGAVGGYAALAQPTPPAGPPPAASDAPPPPPPPGGHRFMHRHGPGPGQMGPGGPGGPGGGPMMGGPMGPRGPLTSLVMRRDDKQITADEATKIAEGFLLWMGERDWKVANATQQEGVIRFDLTTKEGGRIATFTMDRKTGQVKRVG